MIIKIGLALMVFVGIPALIVGVLITLANLDELDDPEDEYICGNCDYCMKDGPYYICDNERSLWYEEQISYTEDGCSRWENI